MPLHGQSIIAGKATPSSGGNFHATNPATGETLVACDPGSTSDLADAALHAADAAFDEFRAKSPEQRAELLEAIADGTRGAGGRTAAARPRGDRPAHGAAHGGARTH